MAKYFPFSIVDLQCLLIKGFTLMVGGYAESGKSTLIQNLRSQAQGVISLSETCHEIARELEPNRCRINTKEPRERERMINFIENGLMKHVGRESMVKSVMKSYQPGSVIETIGGEEMLHYIDCLPDEQIRYTVLINVRSTEEKPLADLRQLLPTEIYYSRENLSPAEVNLLPVK